MRSVVRALLMGSSLCAAFMAAPAIAAEDDTQIWMNASTGGMITDKLHLNIDGNYRLAESGNALGQAQGRATLSVKVADGVLLGGGYSFIHKTSADEHRYFLQGSYPLFDLGKVAFSGRTRLEMRDFSNLDGMRYRARQQVKATIPLEGVEGLKAVIYTEAFILLNDHADDPAGLDQFRTFAGLNVPIVKSFALEAGYMNQTTLPGNNMYNHILHVSLSHSF